MRALTWLLVVITGITLMYGTAVNAKNISHKTLMFFYSSECAYCHEMADILLKIATKHKVRIIANGTDSKKLTQFPNAISDVSLMSKFKIIAFPTLIAIDMQKKEFELMCNGLEDENLIEAKIIAWINYA